MVEQLAKIVNNEIARYIKEITEGVTINKDGYPHLYRMLEFKQIDHLLYFINELISKTESSEEYQFPLLPGEDKMDLARFLDKIIFDLEKDGKRVNRDADVDIILNSARVISEFDK